MRMAPNFVETLRLWIPAAGKTGYPLEGEMNTFHMQWTSFAPPPPPVFASCDPGSKCIIWIKEIPVCYSFKRKLLQLWSYMVCDESFVSL